MAKFWIANLFLALTAGDSIVSNMTRVQRPPFAIRTVYGNSTWSAPVAIIEQSRSPLKGGRGWNSYSRTATGGNRPTKDLTYGTSVLHPGVQSTKSNCLEFDIYYHGSDIKKVEDGTVRCPQVCQRMCVQIPRCAYWTYVLETSSCYLKSRAAPEERKWKPATVSGPRTCPFACESCYESDTGYYGPDMNVFVEHFVRSAEECHLVCLAFPTCHLWTWVSSQRNCYLKKGNARLRIHAPGSISGPRQCATTASPCHGGRDDLGYEDQGSCEHECYDHNVLYTGIDAEVKTTASGPKECQYFCQQHPFCRAFSYLSMEKTCMLKSSHGTILPHPNAVSGPRVCYTPDCAIKDVVYYGKKIETNFATSVDACHKVCQSNSLCSAVTFHEGSQHCSLIQRAEHAKGFVSGFKWCTSRGRKNVGNRIAATATGTAHTSWSKGPVCYDAGLAYTSRPFSANHFETAELCQRHCQANSRCKVFTYFFFGKTCLMHDYEGQRVPNETAASGQRLCSASTSACFYEDVEVYGKDVGKCTTESAAACQMVCQRNEQCSFFVYQIVSKLCLQRQHRGPASGTTSAPVFCGKPNDEITLFHEKPQNPQKPDADPPKANPDEGSKPVHPHDDTKLGVEPDISRQPDTQDVDVSEPDRLPPDEESPGIPDQNQTPTTPDTEPPAPGTPTGGKPDTPNVDVSDPDQVPPEEMPPERPDQNERPTKPDAEEPGPGVSTSDDAIAEKPEGNGSLPNSPVPEKPDGDPCVSPESDCFSVGFYNDSVSIEDSLTESVDECQKKCESHELCNYFSFFRDSGACTLHILAGNQMLKREAVTGPWKCLRNPRTQECFALGEYKGKEVNTKEVNSTVSCYKLCFAQKNCKFFSYVSESHTCKLFEDVTEVLKSFGTVSGPKLCNSGQTNLCIQEGISCSGTQVGTPTQVQSREACLAACQKEESCAYYSYEKTTQECTLIEDSRQDTAKSSAACGARHCVPLSFDPACFHKDSTYIISEPKIVRAQTSAECYLLCTQQEDCRYFAFNGKKKCDLGKKVSGVKGTANGVAGPLHCPARFFSEGCVTKSLRYVGDTLDTLENITKTEQCREKCADKLPQCRLFTLKDNICTLYKTKIRSVSDREAVSGWVTCPDKTTCENEKGVDARYHTTYASRKGGFEQCQDECRHSPTCTAAAWDPSGEAADCYISAIFRIEPGQISGPVSCGAEVSPLWTSLWGGQTPNSDSSEASFCIKKNTSYSATPFQRFSAASTEECQKRCQRHCGCRFFSHNTTDSICSLYKRPTPEREQVGHYSASAWCNPPPVNCAAENIAVEEVPVKEQKMSSLEACVKLCGDNNDSTFYTFNTFTRHCSCGRFQEPGTFLRTIIKSCL